MEEKEENIIDSENQFMMEGVQEIISSLNESISEANSELAIAALSW
jgi:hypothetical protein